MSFELIPLPYSYDALEPYIDKMTMELHHNKHHATYIANLNKALEERNEKDRSIEEIIKNISKYPVAVRNNGGGHYNHELFWNVLSPNGGSKPAGHLSDAIDMAFGDFEKFRETFTNSALTRFGSGWVWLMIRNDGKLTICSTPNQDNPLMDIAECRGIPILGLDVWEHAYYLKYHNRRAEYINAFWNVVNWDFVQKRFSEVR